MGKHKMRFGFEPTAWDSPFGFSSPGYDPYANRPQTARGWHEPAPRGHPYGYSRQQETLARQQAARKRQEEQQRRMVAQQLQAYGFHDYEAVERAMDEEGLNVNACVRHLLQRERQQQRTEKACGRGSPSTSRSASRSSRSASSEQSPRQGSALEAMQQHSPTPRNIEVDSSDDEQSEYEGQSTREIEVDSSDNESEALPSKDEAARVLQGMVRGGATRHDVAALVQCSEATENVLNQTEAERAKWEPWVLAQQWRECKMLGEVPVDLIAYEEALLRLQMKLDNIQAGNVSQVARDTVRTMRRDAVRRIQQHLDRIDECKQWWHQHGKLEAAGGVEAEP